KRGAVTAPAAAADPRRRPARRGAVTAPAAAAADPRRRLSRRGATTTPAAADPRRRPARRAAAATTPAAAAAAAPRDDGTARPFQPQGRGGPPDRKDDRRQLHGPEYPMAADPVG